MPRHGLPCGSRLALTEHPDMTCPGQHSACTATPHLAFTLQFVALPVRGDKSGPESGLCRQPKQMLSKNDLCGSDFPGTPWGPKFHRGDQELARIAGGLSLPRHAWGGRWCATGD